MSQTLVFTPPKLGSNNRTNKAILNFNVAVDKTASIQPLVELSVSDGNLRLTMVDITAIRKTDSSDSTLFDDWGSVLGFSLNQFVDALRRNLREIIALPVLDQLCKIDLLTNRGITPESLNAKTTFQLTLLSRIRGDVALYREGEGLHSWAINPEVVAETTVDTRSKYLLLRGEDSYCFGWSVPLPKIQLFHVHIARKLEATHPRVLGGGSFHLNHGKLELRGASDKYDAPPLDLVEDAARALVKIIPPTIQIENVNLYGRVTLDFDLP